MAFTILSNLLFPRKLKNSHVIAREEVLIVTVVFALDCPRPKQDAFLLISLWVFTLHYYLEIKVCINIIQNKMVQFSQIWKHTCYAYKRNISFMDNY